MNKKIKIAVGVLLVSSCFGAGVLFASFYQPEEKTLQLYSNALKDFKNEEYQNSYYLFPKLVSYLN